MTYSPTCELHSTFPHTLILNKRGENPVLLDMGRSAFVEVGMSQTLTLLLSNVGSEPVTLSGANGLAQPFAFASTPT